MLQLVSKFLNKICTYQNHFLWLGTDKCVVELQNGLRNFVGLFQQNWISGRD